MTPIPATTTSHGRSTSHNPHKQEHFCAQPLALFQQRHNATLDRLILLEKNMSFIDNCNDSVLSGM
jgi:hypothetical protein